MAKKKLTPEQENQIKTLLANNEMLEKTKKEAQERGNKASVQQIERAQEDVIEHIKMIDPNAATPTISSSPLSAPSMPRQDVWPRRWLR